MKQLRLFIYILIIGFLFGCESETIPSASTNLVGKISTRGSNDIPSLPTGSQALFHTSSGTKIFTFDGNNWNGDQSIFSYSSTTPNMLTALYPAYNGNSLITENPYTSDGLEDVLIAQSTITSEKNIELTFKHLFSKLTIHILSPLKESVNRISLEMPRIEKLNTDGSFSLSGTYISTPELNEDGDYTFIIPPTENCNIILSFTIGDQTVSHSLTHTFESGYKYECKIKEPGIYDANDLIEFSKIINRKKEGDLSRYGELQEDGRMLYHLYTDIDFAYVDSQELLPIGYYDGPSVIFSDIFDGQGHTISNLILPDKSINKYVEESHSGLFGSIGINGIIKNLHIINAKTVVSPICNNVGGIAAKNKGTIKNCSVQNSSFTSSEGGYVGAICGNMTEGYIINCHSSYNNLIVPERGFAGGIIGGSCGNIFNSYAYDNQFKGVEGSYAGGFIGSIYTIDNTYHLNIANSYVLHTKTYNYWGAFIGIIQSNNFSFDNTFYNGGKLVYNKDDKYSGIYQYKYSTFQTEINNINKHVYEHLNNWIKKSDTTQYPYSILKTWMKSDTAPYPAIFAE